VIAYFDTSALVPLLVTEAGSGLAARFWDGADRVVSSRLVYPEARAAIAHAHRIGRLTVGQLRAVVGQLDDRCTQLEIIEIDERLAHQAGSLAEAHGLRGYDAVHLAAARELDDSELVLVAGDRALLAAARAEGLMTAAIG
jgi:predicted nucleic acid-binding protein